MRKKAYYFGVEAILALLIMSSIFVVLLFFRSAPVPIPEYRYAQNIAGYLDNVRVDEFCAMGCGSPLNTLLGQDMTLSDAIGSQYTPADPTQSRLVANEIMSRGGLFDPAKNVVLLMKAGAACDELYKATQDDFTCETGANSTTEVAFKKLIQGFTLDESTGELNFWGDFIFEVRVW